MSKVSYFIRSAKKGDSEVSIWIRVHHNGDDIRISTSITCPSRCWSSRMGWVKDIPFESNALKERASLVSEKLYTIKHKVYIYLINNEKVTSNNIKNIISNHLNGSRKNICSMFNFKQYVEAKIIEMESKEFLNKGEPYSPNAISNWKKFLNLWNTFEGDGPYKNIYIDNITMRVYYAFMDFCDANGYKKSTKYQYARIFKAALNYALLDKVSNNRVHFNRNFATHTTAESHKGIYLTMEEIVKIQKLNIVEGSTYAKIRDLFLLGCYTGLRFSDYSLISLDDIVDITIDGKKYYTLFLKQKKTNQEVMIPLLSNDVQRILKKYNGKAPKVSISCFNREIKYICALAGITDIIKVTENIGGKEVVKWVKKNQLVSSHTSRRTCITNLYLSRKLDSVQIRSISGHRSEQAFMRYLCLSKEENVKTILKKISQD